MTTPSWTSVLNTSHNVRLVVSDMDGTLLAGDGAIPATFWPLLKRMGGRGITFVPASGRQYASMARMFTQASIPIPFIADNGSLIVRDGAPFAATYLDAPVVLDVVQKVRNSTTSALDLGLVVSGRRGAYIERGDTEFVAEVEKYYAQLTKVDDLTTITDDVLKLSIYDFADAETAAVGAFAPLRTTHQVVISAKHWIDIMARGANKGRAVEQLQQSLGVTAAQTVVFGDYLNDLEMLDHADLSFAMANAHPAVKSRAKYLAPANEEHGVVTVLSHLLS